MRAYVPNLPIAPQAYSADNEAQFRREIERVLRDMQQARPEDFVTISNDSPSGTPPQGPGSLWVGTLGAGESPYNLDNLTDVTVTGVSEGHVLQYVSGEWINQNLDLALTGLSDVTITTPVILNAMMYSGSAWVNRALTTVDIQSGTFANARIAASNVTQHEAALAIAFTQLTGTIANAQVPVGAVTQHQAALSIAASQVTTGTFGAGSYTFPSTTVFNGSQTISLATTVFQRMTNTTNVDESWDFRVGTGGNFEIRQVTDAGTTVTLALSIAVNGNLTWVGAHRSGSGSAAIPAYSFSSYTDHGMYTSSTGLFFAVDGVLAGGFVSSGYDGDLADYALILHNNSMVITGDFGRFGDQGLRFQAIGTNMDGNISVMPSGTATTAQLRLYNDSDPANAGAFGISVQAGVAHFTATVFGTGVDVTSYRFNDHVVYFENKILNSNGSVSAPSYAFENDSNTGMYSYAANDIGFATAGALQFRITSDYIYPYNQIRHVSNGTIGAPSYSFNNDPDTGAYLVTTGTLGFTTGGALRLQVNSTAVAAFVAYRTVASTTGVFQHAGWGASTFLTSNISYVSGNIDVSTNYQYIDSVGASQLGGALINCFANGTSRGIRVVTFPDSTGAGTNPASLNLCFQASDLGIAVESGTLAQPGIRFLADSDTGFYWIGANSIGVSVGGNLALTINSTAVTLGSIPLNNNGNSTRDKLRVWNSALYTIGMGSNYNFGGLDNDYAMTFQMNDSSTRGFWWGDSVHTNSQGAMALNTAGELTVATRIRVGYGESDTTSPAAYAIDSTGGLVRMSTTGEQLRMVETVPTSSPYMTFYQTTTRRAYIQYINGGQFRFVSEEGVTADFAFYCGPASTSTHLKFRIVGIDADEGRVLAENAQLYGGYLNQGTGTGAITIHMDRGNTHHLNNSGSRTVTLSDGQNGSTYLLTIEAIASAVASWTWSTTVEWVNGTPPTLSTTVGVRDIIFLAYSDGVWHGSYTLGHA